MNNADFTAIVQKTIARCTDTLTAKNDEYSAGQDRLHAFRSAAALTSQTMRAALAGMMLKHTVSVYDMCRDDKPHSLIQWDEKICDHINYLLLLRAVIQEEAGGSKDRLHLEEADRPSGMWTSWLSSHRRNLIGMEKSTTNLLSRLAEDAEFCEANEWELPIAMGDDIREAMELIMTFTKETPESNPFDYWGNWDFAGYDMSHGEAHVIWACRKCGYKRLAGWEAPHYGCPECTGRTKKESRNAETASD